MWRNSPRWQLSALLGALCASVAPALSIVPAGPEPSDATAIESPAAEQALFAIPTRIDRIGRIVVPVMINGQGPFRFIVDTGASRSTLSPDVVSRLGLLHAAETQIEVNGITGAAQVPTVMVANLRAGDFAISGESFPVLSAPIMAGADGILGAAGLTMQRLSVDFEHNKVALSEATASATPLGFMRVRAQRLSGGLVAVPAHVGRVNVMAIIDTGSERTLGNIALRDALNLVPRPGVPLETTTVYGATSDAVPGETQVAPTISIEHLRITDVTLTYGDFHIFEVWQMRHTPALIIGMDILGTVAGLTIDFKHQYVYIQGRGVLSASGPDALHAYSLLRTGKR
jgi:predicted aspartyl protease